MKLIKEAETKVFESAAKKIYPDTKKGVEQMLKAFFDRSKLADYDFDTANISPDPFVDGVWKVDFPADPSKKTITRWVVYLAGYRDHMRQMREENDVEEGEVKNPDYDSSLGTSPSASKGKSNEDILLDLLGGKLNDAMPEYDFFVTDVSLRDDRVSEEEPKYQAAFDWEELEDAKNHGKGTVEFTCGINKLGTNTYNITDMTIFDLRGIRGVKINPSFLPK